jgi:isopenicillin-N epimerase
MRRKNTRNATAKIWRTAVRNIGGSILGRMQPTADDLRAHWTLDPEVVFLNHGSFGACPRPVLAEQDRLRAQLEREPVQFFLHTLGPLLDAARVEVGAFVGARPEDLVFVRNATAGVNAVLASLRLEPGDELLTTDHVYHACHNALRHVCARAGARVVVAPVPFPIAGPDEVLATVLAGVSARTRLVLIDHITSPTGVVLPVAEIVAALASRGIDTLVDGAHAPGMVPLDLEALGAAYYTGNFHKWVCAPKGAAMLHVRRDRQATLHPSVISHGYDSRRSRPALWEEFDWTGTDDPSAWLCVPTAIRFLGQLVPGGWPALRARNHALLLAGRDIVAAALEVRAPVPDAMLGNLAALPLPDGVGAPSSALYADPLQVALFERHHIEVPVPPWPAPPRRLIRISAQVYNRLSDYEALATALRAELRAGR